MDDPATSPRESGGAHRFGWPIATGIIEGACRHLVKDRFDITGARWGLDGAHTTLTLRALTINGDLEEYWTYHFARRNSKHVPASSESRRVSRLARLPNTANQVYRGLSGIEPGCPSQNGAIRHLRHPVVPIRKAL
jgi:hypothetical protein